MMFRYDCSTWSLDHSLDILVEITSSLALRTTPPIPERASPTNAFLTYCRPFVEPTCRSPPTMSHPTQRAKPVNEKPGKGLEIRASAAITVLRTCLPYRTMLTTTRLPS